MQVPIAWLLVLAVAQQAAGSARLQFNVSLSNVVLPHDTANRLLTTGEADVMQFNGSYFFYFNNWGGCPDVDCCPTSDGCASCCFKSSPFNDPCVYTDNHTVVVYETKDLTSFTYHGIALPLAARPSPRIEFRPHVLYNAKTSKFVMWFESRTSKSMYAVALSDTPQGPFQTVTEGIELPGHGRVGDYALFVDDDGTAYHVRTGFDIVKLDDTYTKPTAEYTSFTTPLASEAPIMFKRQGTYFIIAGTSCCACKGGSTVYLLSSSTPLGHYTYLGDYGRNRTHAFDMHSPFNFVTRAQPTAVFTYTSCANSTEFMFMGNQWVTSQQPGRPRNHDLLFFQTLQFTANNTIESLEWRQEENICVML